MNRYYLNLIEKYLDGSINKSEAGELNLWIKNNSSIADWWESEMVNTSNEMSEELRLKMFNNICAKLEDTNNTTQEYKIEKYDRKKLFKRILRIAAVICLPLLASYFVYVAMNHNLEVMLSESTSIVKADKGDKATITLPDGTSVLLNSASQLAYTNDFGRIDRKVKLDGEGYFTVAKDKEKPFLVEIDELEVKVLGTVFSICAYQYLNNVTIVLLEGSVEVISPNGSREMLPNEKLTYNRKARAMQIEEVYANDYIAWTKGSLYFENETMANIMQMLSQVYDINIIIESEALANQRFTGTIPGHGIQKTLDILRLTSTFTYDVKDSTIIIKNTK